MLITSFFLLIILLIIYVLLVPIDLLINTNTNQYYIQIKGLAKASLEKDNVEILRIKLRMFFMNFYFHPLKYIGLTEKKKIVKKNKVKRKRKIGLKKSLQILKSFKVKRFDLEMDTGDYTLNAKLYPVFAFLNYNVGHFKVNFEDRNQLVLHLQNRPIDIIKSFIN